MNSRPILVAAAFALGVALPVAAQTLYKLIDKNGKVTYSESPPKDYDGKVIRLDIDPKANRATLPKASSQREAVKPGGATSSSGGGDRSLSAREKVDAAKKALQDAIDNPGEDDVRRVGTAKGGARPVPTEEYEKRLEGLRENVRKAEEELRIAEGR